VKKIILSVVAITCATIFLVLFTRHHTHTSAVTLSWHEITPATRNSFKPTLDALQNVYVEAFVPLVKPDVYKHDPRLVNIPPEHRSLAEPKVVAGITHSLQSGWPQKIDSIYTDLLTHRIAAAYVTVAKDHSNNVIGFALFTEEPMKDNLEPRIITITEGSRESITKSPAGHDEAYVWLLAVAPHAQHKGLGKTLLFSILDHCPHIKKIYLTTSASDSNEQAQRFYEHVGFERILKGSFVVRKEDDSAFERAGKIVYLYQKN
jgi:ribosomal protein S18 acetylase RimI-like enzyme